MVRSFYLVLVLVLLVASGACASLEPLAPNAPATVDDERVARHLTLTAIEGQPQGLVLRIEGAEVEAVETLELFRVGGEGEPTLLHALPADDRIRRNLSEGGIELLDDTLVPGESYAYQVLGVMQDEVVETSSIVEVVWNPPPVPEAVTAAAHLPDAVEIDWDAPCGCGAIIFRRDVLADGAFERHAVVRPPHSDWVDRDVRAAGVWSYRVALSRDVSDVSLYGPPSVEVYASTPPEDPH